MKTEISCQARLRLYAVALVVAPLASAVAQSGGYIVTLGTDTIHAEHFTRTPERIVGVIVTRSPVTRIARYEIRFENGRPSHYEVRTTRADGTPESAPGANATMTLVGDTLTRESAMDGVAPVQHIAARTPVLPGPGLPYVGVSYLMYELAFAEARSRATPAGESTVRFVTMLPRQTVAPATRVWFVGTDSVEMDYFGVARSGYKLDAAGRLARADWTRTTYAYRIARVSAVNVEKIAEAWYGVERARGAMGALSPRDTARGTIGNVSFTVEYSRPSRRGRSIWGGVVPWGRVWRLGADMATHVQFTGDVTLAGTAVPAGRYTLWMIPSDAGESQLIVSRLLNVFGTQYNPSGDLVRIPLRKDVQNSSEQRERFTIEHADERIWFRWGDLAWSVPVAPSGPPADTAGVMRTVHALLDALASVTARLRIVDSTHFILCGATGSGRFSTSRTNGASAVRRPPTSLAIHHRNELARTESQSRALRHSSFLQCGQEGSQGLDGDR